MSLSVVIDATKTPMEMTVTSDRRKVPVAVTVAGETATGAALFPVKIIDSSNRVWTSTSDDGTKSVYTG